jgi:drug/metabolite transporter (DMT)-like permease
MSLTDRKEHRFAGQAAILITAFLWSTSGLTIKLISWHPVVIVGSRSILAAVFLFVVRLIVPPSKDTKNKAFPLWSAAIAYALTMITFVIANKLTTAANAILLQYSAPVWAALLGWHLVREKPKWEHWGALVLAAGGLVLFFRDSLGSGALLGDALAILSGMFFGAFSVFMRMMKDGDPRDAMLLSHVISAGVSIPFMILYPPVFTVSTTLSVLYMGLVQIGLSSLLISYGIKRVTAMQAMLIATLEAVLSPLWVLAIIGEKPSLQALTGGVVIFAAVVSSSFIGMRREARATNIKQ